MADEDRFKNSTIQEGISKLPHIEVLPEDKINKGDLDHLPKLNVTIDNDFVPSNEAKINKGDLDHLPKLNVTDEDLEEEQSNPTIAQKAFSYIMISASMISMPFIGMPLLELGAKDAEARDRFIERLRLGWQIFERGAPLLAKPLEFLNSAKRSFFKNSLNLGVVIINIALFAYNGSSLSFLKDTFIGNAASYIGTSLRNGWNKLEQVPYIGAIARGISFANQKKTNFIASKTFSNALLYTSSLMSLGLGPVGLAIATAATSIDVAVGAIEVNNARVIRDELEHLRSLFNSLKKIKALENGSSKTAQPDKPSLIPEVENARSTHSIFRKSLSLLVSAQMLNVATSGAKALANPVELATLGAKIAISAGSIAYGQLTEDDARVAMQAEINQLRKTIVKDFDPNFFYDITKSRKYDLGEMALNQAVYAQKLELSSKNETKSEESIRQEIQKNNPLFGNYRCTQPKTNFAYIGKALRSSYECVADYLHPFNPITNYISVCKETSPRISPIEKPKQQETQLKRSKSMTGLTNQVPKIKRSRSQTF